jgi:hypothetical protein
MTRLASLLILLAFTPTLALATTYVVKPDGTGDFPTIQAAIDAASDGDVVELAAGTFIGDGNRNMDFLGKAITVRSQSGNPSFCIVDCEGFEGAIRRGFKFTSEEDSTSVLEGITIRNGVAEADGDDRNGGAVACIGSSPTIRNCRFVDCRAWPGRGGGVYCELASPTISFCSFVGDSANGGGGLACVEGSAPPITNCTFIDNRSPVGGGLCCRILSNPVVTNCDFLSNIAGGAGGGAVVCTNSSTPSFVGCRFRENWAAYQDGGAINTRSSSHPSFEDCVFSGNKAERSGGAVKAFSPISFTTCVFAENEAIDFGGALDLSEETQIEYCTFYANAAANGAAMNAGGDFLLGNCIIAFNEGYRAVTGCTGGDPPARTVVCCDVFGNPGGDYEDCLFLLNGTNGNISEDPLFCDPENGDYTLQSGSPCLPGHHPDGEQCGVIGALAVGCPVSSVPGDIVSVPQRLVLSGPRPNPSTSLVVFDMNLAHAERVRIGIYDVRGRLVERLLDRVVNSGRHSIMWEVPGRGSDLSSGVYYIRVRSGREDVTRKVIVVH